MRKTTHVAGFAGVLSGVALVGILAAVALGGVTDKPPAPPGKDPCSHGNTGKECRPDPQPDRGKDCEHHGNEGGINEDHCASATQPPTNSPPPTIIVGKPGKPVTVETKPGDPVTVSGPAVVVEKGKDTITVKPTKPGIIKVKQPTKVTLIGVPRQDEVGESLTG